MGSTWVPSERIPTDNAAKCIAMTFALVRAGLPNSIALLALALTPLFAITFASAEQTQGPPGASVGVTIGTAGTGPSAGERATLD